MEDIKNKITVLIGSKNPVKINATKEAFSHFFDEVEAIGISTESNVSEQPVGKETYDGSKNRALSLYEKAQEKFPQADYFVGIEGGIEESYSQWFCFGVICIVDTKKRISFGKSAQFTLPNTIVQRLLDGYELGPLMDEYTNQNNIKQKNGAIGILTQNVLLRTDLYVPGIISALIPFINKELYFPPNNS